MSIQRIPLWLPLLSMLILWEMPFFAVAVDPSNLQKQGISQVDGFIDHFRKTGDQQTLLPDLHKATQELSQSLQMFRQQGDYGSAALSLVKLGDIQRMLNLHQQAISLYEEGLRVAKQANHPENQAKALLGLARTEMYGLRNYGSAETYVQTALPLTAGLEKKDLHIDALDYQAQVQIFQGNLIAALATLNRALAMAGNSKDETQLYYIYLDRAETYQKLGEQCDYRRAFSVCYEAFKLSKADYQKAKRLARKFGWHGLVNQTDGFLQRLGMRRNLIELQEKFHTQIQKTTIFHPKKPEDVFVQESFAAGNQTIPDGILGIIQATGATADAGDPRSLFIRGLFHEMQGNNDAAQESFLKSVDALERDRRDLQNDQSRGTFLQDKIEFYYPPILHFLDRLQYQPAFNLLERSRARALVDLLGSRNLSMGSIQERQAFGETMSLRTQIAKQQKDLFRKRSQPDREKYSSEIMQMESKIQQLEQQHSDVLKQLGVKAPKLQTLLSPSLPTLDEVQKQLQQENYEILEYLILESQIVLWHISGNAIQVKSVFLPRTEVIKKVKAIRKTLTEDKQNFDNKTSQELFLFLIQPVLKDIRAQHLVIIPHDELNQLPFQVLRNPENQTYLGEQFQISYAPSASILMQLQRSGQIARKHLLAVADPKIAAAPKEVAGIASLYPDHSKAVIDRLVTKTELRQWVKDYELIHLSIHGEFNADEPLLSHVQLAPSKQADGKLTAAEMFGLPLDKAQLVVLSSCESGRVETSHSNETQGIVRGLLYAGAQTLILSAWKVDEDSTALWMKTFYQAAQTQPLGEAARLALIAVKSQYPHPYYWGAFLMIGK